MANNKKCVVASFDVGIKNLAFCVLEYDSTADCGSQFPIQAWRCVDVTDKSGIGERICEGHKKNGDKCINGARIMTDEDAAFCGVHNPDKKRYIPKESTKVKSLSYETLGNAFMDELDSHSDLWNKVDHIIIEQQFNKNRRMIFLSAMIFSYFIALQRDPNCKITRVKFASSRNKLKVYGECGGPEITERPRKGAKDHRKWLAPKHCEWLARNDKELSYFRRYPRKKDDLADSFLQGADYLFHECRAVKRTKQKKRAPKRPKKKKRKPRKKNYK
ncbi:MAG: hypothetical protein DRI46_11945 [Chloroflexi bacterium]|nr:MAG: hypothetical protein DRI46_11945 [Chloroflexota bacterium]